jgi:signal transduction histidine kinase
MMERVDKTWIKATNNLQAVYSYLRPGDYVFNVKCQNADGTSSKHITRLHLSVSAPFWKAWWFYSLIVLAGGGLFFWLERERRNRKFALQKMRSQIAGNLHKELSNALNNINILSEMARIKADREPQKSKEYIEQIHAKSNNMIIVMDDMLWSLSPDNDSMKKTVERMLEYIDELKNKHAVDITMVVDKKGRIS